VASRDLSQVQVADGTTREAAQLEVGEARRRVRHVRFFAFERDEFEAVGKDVANAQASRVAHFCSVVGA
jgi:hypothetical protein